jgi:uncharacterized protein (DUF1330 family)
MSAFFMVSVTIKNNADRLIYNKYLDEAKPVIEAFGGKIIVRGEKVTPVSGSWLSDGSIPDMIIVMRFPTKHQLNACFDSDEYRGIRAIGALNGSSVAAEAVIVEQPESAGAFFPSGIEDK